MFELPSGFVSGITSNATSAISALSPVVQLVLGVLLATTVIVIIIKAVRG